MTGGLFIGVFNKLKAKVWHDLTIKVGVIVAEDWNESWIEDLLDLLRGCHVLFLRPIYLAGFIYVT